MPDLQTFSAKDFPNLKTIHFPGPDGSGSHVLRSMQTDTGQLLWAEESAPLGPPGRTAAQRSEHQESLSIDADDPDILRVLAPPLSSTIEAANFNTNSTHTGFFFIPPDPIAAAGPNHVVNVVNVTVEWYTKAGVQQNSQSLASFFSALPAPLPRTFTFDPKVIYDQYNDRFVIVTLEQTDTAAGDPANTSFIFLAVSDDSDPNGTWYQQVITSTVMISSTDHWADYPGLAVDDEAIYITNNMFTFGTFIPGGVRLWIVDKGAGSGGLYDGGTSTVSIHNPYASGGWPVTTQPAHMFGTAPSGVGTFLVGYSGLNLGGNEYIQVVRVDDPLGTPTFPRQSVNAGNIDNTATGMPDAPQLGSATAIEANDRRALQAVWRDDSLWLTAQVVPPSGGDAGQATAHWFQLDTTNLGSLSLADQGNAGGNDIDAGAYTFMPSIMVDQNGSMALGFALSSPNH
ncbi:MAG: hypothetical protein GTO04_18060, partial [Planctomycetales bacterium]|nr:hypothetical protein [Planctomycetales bacterium]